MQSAASVSLSSLCLCLPFPPSSPACVSRIAVAVVKNNGVNEKHFKFNTHECMHGRALMSPDELRAGGMMGGKGMEVNGTSGREGRWGGGGGGRGMFAPL